MCFAPQTTLENFLWRLKYFNIFLQFFAQCAKITRVANDCVSDILLLVWSLISRFADAAECARVPAAAACAGDPLHRHSPRGLEPQQNANELLSL